MLLTDEELGKLKEFFPDYQDRIERLGEYIASKGVRYKSHYATVLAWARKDGVRISGEEIKQAAMDLSADVSARIAVEADKLLRANIPGVSKGQSVGQLLDTAVDSFMCDDGQGVRFGMGNLDRFFPRGIAPTNVLVIAGKTGTGKSAFALTFARKLAREGKLVLYFSFEMSCEEQMHRLLEAESGVSEEEALCADMTRSMAIMDAADRISKWRDNLVFFDNVPATVENIALIAKGYNMRRKVNCIIIDHLHLLDTKGYKGKVDALETITAALKRLAISMNCLVVELSQLSRAGRERADKEPQLDDLRSSGSIAQNANIVMMINRDQQVNGDSSIAKICITKNRNGSNGVAALTFVNKLALFYQGKVQPVKESDDSEIPY